jgi:hypothetical protein
VNKDFESENHESIMKWLYEEVGDGDGENSIFIIPNFQAFLLTYTSMLKIN